MQVSFKSYNQNIYQPKEYRENINKTNSEISYRYGTPQLALNYYHPSFCGMKKNAFDGVDYYVVDKYKAPIEKFRTVDYLYEWADEQCDKIMEENYYGRTPETMAQRVAMLDEWKDYFERWICM